jgi:hypothetical protein
VSRQKDSQAEEEDQSQDDAAEEENISRTAAQTLDKKLELDLL